MKTTDFDYNLPEELIARYPLKGRSQSRLLCLDANKKITHSYFYALTDLIQPNDLIICNNSKVIPARLHGQKETGGKVEVLVERILDHERVLAHIRASKPPKPQTKLIFDNNVIFEMIARAGDLFELKCLSAQPVLEVIEQIGELPLPPYFNRSPEEEDKNRYQTIYAQYKGSVAAPTAGLHFDEMLFEKLRQKGVSIAYVTLHVGAGTFQPVRVDDVRQHTMHAEYCEVSEELCLQVAETKKRGGRIIAVGTTSARSLESAALGESLAPYKGDTSIFIYPGFKFKVVDVLITNFHLPCSTLLMLVSALAGFEHIKAAYREAIDKKYRFYSYGDAMWLES